MKSSMKLLLLAAAVTLPVAACSSWRDRSVERNAAPSTNASQSRVSGSSTLDSSQGSGEEHGTTGSPAGSSNSSR